TGNAPWCGATPKAGGSPAGPVRSPTEGHRPSGLDSPGPSPPSRRLGADPRALGSDHLAPAGCITPLVRTAPGPRPGRQAGVMLLELDSPPTRWRFCTLTL